MSLAPICVACHTFYDRIKSGVAVEEGMPVEDAPDRHLRHLPGWQPYKLWMGDLWECPNCNQQIVVGTGHNRIAEHYEPNYEQTVERFVVASGRDLIVVDDC
jgi:hypothetical protein